MLCSDDTPDTLEICDGEDNDCDGIPDNEDGINPLCPIGPNTVGTLCMDGACEITGCLYGYFDHNGNWEDGCECGPDVNWMMAGGDWIQENGSCGQADHHGTLTDNDGDSQVITGNATFSAESDWYAFFAEDTDETEPGYCDRFNVKVEFIENPNDQFAFDLKRGACGQPVLCTEVDAFDMRTDFYEAGTDDGFVGGECPCSRDEQLVKRECEVDADCGSSAHQCIYGFCERPCASDANCVLGDCDYPFPKATQLICIGEHATQENKAAPNKHLCTDQSAMYYVRVYRKDGFPLTCDNYKLKISNGIQ